MRFLAPLIVGTVSLVAAGSALVEWRDGRAIRSLDVAPAEPLLPAQEIALLRRAAESSTGIGIAHARLGARLRREAEQTADPKARVGLFCESLGALGEAIRREPENAAYLINWANLRQLLGGVECRESYTVGDFRGAAAAALAADPTNTRVLYAAAQLASWTGDEAEVDRTLNRFLALKVELKASEVEFVFSKLLDATRVERIVPPRFPHVTAWSRAMRMRKPDLYRELHSVWARLQLAAVGESSAELAREAIPLDLHRRRLTEIVEVAAEPVVQQRVDGELAGILRTAGNLELAGYFAARSTLEELPVVRAVQRSDTRPSGTAVVGWGYDDVVVFDEFFTTLGLYVPRGYQPRIVQLVGATPGSRLESATIQVLGSNDNQNWSQLSDRFKPVPLTLGELSGLALELDGGSFRYWKIHFGSAERTRTFRNSLAKLVKVYGVRWAE